MSMVKIFALILGYFLMRMAVSDRDHTAEKGVEINNLRAHVTSADSFPPI